MDPRLMPKESQIIKIDLDPAEELLCEWDRLVQKKLLSFSIIDNENVLIEMMKEYLQTLREMPVKFNDNEDFRRNLFGHISFLYSLYTELQCCTPNNYLRVMEDILTVYYNTEIAVVGFVKGNGQKKIEKVCKRIIYVLTMYLLDRHDHIQHVLIKGNTDDLSVPGVRVLRGLYQHFLVDVPVLDRGDESFCRSYILFQKWKQIESNENWESLDKILCQAFGRTEASVKVSAIIKESPVLRQILMAPSSSTVGVIYRLFLTPTNMSNAYFKYMENKKLKNCDWTNRIYDIDSSEDEAVTPIEVESDQDVEFRFNEMEKMLTEEKVHVMSGFRVICKEENKDDDDDDVIFVPLDEEPVKRHIVSNVTAKGQESMSEVENTELLNNTSTLCQSESSCSTKSVVTEGEERNTKVSLVSKEQQLQADPIVVHIDSREDVLCEITTPSFEQAEKPEETLVYVNDRNVDTNVKSVEVQMKNSTGQFSLGLTPPTDAPSEDHSTFENAYCPKINQTQIEKDNDLRNFSENSLGSCDLSSVEMEVEDIVTIEEHHLNDSCVNSNQIDTGQQPHPNADTDFAYNDSQTKDTGSRYNGQVSQSGAIVCSLKDYVEFEDIMSGPVSSTLAENHHNIPIQPENTEVRVEQELLSPICKQIDTQDFHKYYTEYTKTHASTPVKKKVDKGDSIIEASNKVSPPRNSRPRGLRDLTTSNIWRKKNIQKDNNYSKVSPINERHISFAEDNNKSIDSSLNRVSALRSILTNGVQNETQNPEPIVMMERLKVTATYKYVYKKKNKKDDEYPHDQVTVYTDSAASPSNLSGKVNIAESPKKIVSKCAKNQYSCCNELSKEFTKLNCHVAEKDTLTVALPSLEPIPESEFSNSPKFLQDPDEVVQHCLEETSLENETSSAEIKLFLSDNSNFYKNVTNNNYNNKKLCNADASSLGKVKPSKSCNQSVQLPTVVPDSYDFDKNLKNEVFSKIDTQTLEKEDSEDEIKLPLKKRKLSVAQKNEELLEKAAKTEEISYPATPMISIAEALHLRKFKTPAERKEMPPIPTAFNVESDSNSPVSGQFNINNHTYNNPTINYHMSNVPVPLINVPCGSYYLPPILVPFSNVSNFNHQTKLNLQQDSYLKRDKKQGRQRRRH